MATLQLEDFLCEYKLTETIFGKKFQMIRTEILKPFIMIFPSSSRPSLVKIKWEKTSPLTPTSGAGRGESIPTGSRFSQSCPGDEGSGEPPPPRPGVRSSRQTRGQRHPGECGGRRPRPLPLASRWPLLTSVLLCKTCGLGKTRGKKCRGMRRNDE